ncbi:hypothetical protein HHI36_013744 [Cryptolaemus montrouzieri]|uniref:Nuclear nucleic acid-binding protein C1D n=1 Tax=Cryptolaemus montrouzieri TaxID=559131 RepID=A0ABD2NI78_9CUCU
MDYGDLEMDDEIKEKVKNLHDSVDKIDEVLQIAFSENMKETYENLSLKEKVDYDLFIAYALNTLYWLYLRTKGEDPAKNEVKSQLTRVKEYMVKAKEAHERNTIRPTVNAPAAKRFVKHALQIYKDDSEAPERPNKKLNSMTNLIIK